MTDPIKLALIYGSTREGRFCDVVARWAAAEVGDHADFALRVVDPAALDLPARHEREKTAALRALEAELDAAEAFLVVVPEYNHAYPAALKFLIDCFGQPWRAKPVACVSYGGISGGLRAIEQLRLVFAEVHAMVIRDSVSFANARTRFDPAGGLHEPEAPRAAMALLLRQLQWWALALRAARAASPYGEINAMSRRVLVLGRAPAVLETVMQELAALGLAVEGSTEAERAASRFDARRFDLIAFGRGLRGPLSEQLGQDFRRRNPQVRLLDTCAPQAVRQIVLALEGAAQEPQVDLDAYCARIGYAGPRTPTLEVLRALHALHPAAIAFEAIDVMLGRGVDLAPAAVDAKLIGSSRGGYCYEHNGLFRRVLSTIGFAVESLLGRVRWLAPPGAPPRPRTHMALRVTLDGVPWLADVGFGGCVPTAPLRMDVAEPQPTAHESFRLFPFGDALLIQARLGERWTSLYELSPEPQLDVDFEPSNWLSATHPASHFRHRLIVARTTPEARYTLLDAQLTVRRRGGQTARRTLAPDALEHALRETYGLPVEPAWRPVIERAAAD